MQQCLVQFCFSDHPVPSSSSLSTSSAHTGATPVDTNAESIRSEAQQLIEEINAKRTQDTQALADFRKDMELQVIIDRLEECQKGLEIL